MIDYPEYATKTEYVTTLNMLLKRGGGGGKELSGGSAVRKTRSIMIIELKHLTKVTSLQARLNFLPRPYFNGFTDLEQNSWIPEQNS